MTQHQLSLGIYRVCSLMAPQYMPFEYSYRDYIWFSFILETIFYLPVHYSYFSDQWHLLLMFSYYIYRSCVSVCWVSFGRRSDSCYRHLCSKHHYFLSYFCQCLMHAIVHFVWCIMMYVLTCFCSNKLDMLSSLLIRHSYLSSGGYFDIFILVFYSLIYRFFSCVLCVLMSYHCTYLFIRLLYAYIHPLLLSASCAFSGRFLFWDAKRVASGRFLVQVLYINQFRCDSTRS